MVTTRRQNQKSGRTLRSGAKLVNSFNNTPKRKSRPSSIKPSASNKHKVARYPSSTKENTNEQTEPEVVSNEPSMEMEVDSELHGSQFMDIPDIEDGIASLEIATGKLIQYIKSISANSLIDGNGPQPQIISNVATTADGDTVDDAASETPTIPGFEIPLKSADGSMELIEISPELTENKWPYSPPVEERECDTHGTELLCPIPGGHWILACQFENSVESMLESMLNSRISIDTPSDCHAPLHQHIRCVERKGTNEELGTCYFVRWRPYWFPKKAINRV